MSDTLKYFNLAIPAPRRLEMLRKAFAAHAGKYPNCHESYRPKSWRDIRGTTHGSVGAYCGCLDQGFNGEGFARETVWYTHTGEYFRNERDAGPEWYTDEYQEDTAIGIVASLPHGRFLAGYRWTCNDERVYFQGIHDSAEDAARMADEHARVFAERNVEAEEESAREQAAEDAAREAAERAEWEARDVVTQD